MGISQMLAALAPPVDEIQPCAVCSYQRQDYTPKPVAWWPCCDEYICEPCGPNVTDRIIAAIKKWAREC